PRHDRGDGLHLALDFRRRFGLRVERLVLRRGTVRKKENTRFGSAERGSEFVRRSIRRLQSQGIGQSQPECAQPADVERIAARQPVTEFRGGSQNAEHVTPLGREMDASTVIDSIEADKPCLFDDDEVKAQHRGIRPDDLEWRMLWLRLWKEQ